MTIDVSGDGVTVSDVDIFSSETATVNATFTIASDADPGVRNVSVTTENGISNSIDFTIITLKPGNPVPTRITLDPETANSTVLMRKVTVTVLDQNDNPMGGVTVNWVKSNSGIAVLPSSTVTSADGTASFRYRFPFSIASGSITFKTGEGSASAVFVLDK